MKFKLYFLVENFTLQPSTSESTYANLISEDQHFIQRSNSSFNTMYSYIYIYLPNLNNTGTFDYKYIK